MTYAVNCSILFTHLPLLERPGAAKAAGFDAVEFWWPFDTAVPAPAEVDGFVRAIESAGVELTGLNFFAGDMSAGDRGLVSWPGREDEFRGNIAVVAEIGERLGTRTFNALYGNRLDGVDAALQDDLAVENLAAAGAAVAGIGGIVLVEPVSGAPAYPLATADQAVAVIERVRAEHDVDNLRILADFYHLAVNGEDVEAVIDTHGARFGHIQIADAPGRGEPGTGTLELKEWIARSRQVGYDGVIGLEYRATQEDPFAWLPADERSRASTRRAGSSPARSGNQEGRRTTVVAFIGLGVMGAPMAMNLRTAGFDVVGYNRSPDRVADLVAKGGQAAASVAEAVADADVIITMLPDSPDVEIVVLGDDGVLDCAKRGALLIDMSTIRPDVSRMVAARARANGLRPLDAPVSGGEAGAIEGTLSIMVGGDAADFEAAGAVFAAVGATIVHVGPDGSGQTVKAANQLIVAGNIELLSEALVFLSAHGVDLESAVRVLGAGLAGSTVLQRKGASMLAHRFAPGFRVDLHHKDLGILVDAARAAGVAIPLGASVADLMASLRAQGGGSLDHSALVLQVERLSGQVNELGSADS